MLLPRIAGLILCLLFIPVNGVYSFNTGVLFSVYGIINILAASCERFELTDRIRNTLASLPEIDYIEGWGYGATTYIDADGRDGPSVSVFAPPDGSELSSRLCCSSRVARF